MAISKDVTISEIAARANVSIATVSRVINQAGNTKAETKQKVLQAMAELGLNPSTYCGIKAPADSRSILVCLPNFQNPFNADVIEGIQNAAMAGQNEQNRQCRRRILKRKVLRHFLYKRRLDNHAFGCYTHIANKYITNNEIYNTRRLLWNWR